MELRHYLVRLYDVCWREPRIIGKYYSFGRWGVGSVNRNVFMADGRVGHGGMFDRLKGAISVYAVSKAQGRDFRINFAYPFDLRRYLQPADYDWTIDADEVVYRYPHSRPLFLYGECYSPERLLKLRRGEAHFYYGYDSLDRINARYATHYEWGQLYRELFRPTPYLQQYIYHYRQEVGNDYVVVHTRFLNLLGDKVETAINPELPAEEREPLMQQMVQQMVELSGSDGLRMMLASDSMTFIDYVRRQLPEVYVVPGTVKHIDTAGHTDDAENVKMFLDYHLISNARKVYSLVGRGMWPSAFPEYAAKIGNVEFERVTID